MCTGHVIMMMMILLLLFYPFFFSHCLVVVIIDISSVFHILLFFFGTIKHNTHVQHVRTGVKTTTTKNCDLVKKILELQLELSLLKKNNRFPKAFFLLRFWLMVCGKFWFSFQHSFQIITHFPKKWNEIINEWMR